MSWMSVVALIGIALAALALIDAGMRRMARKLGGPVDIPRPRRIL